MTVLKKGSWLGIDVGSARDKVCSFCLIESDGSGACTVSFEHGSARGSYPEENKREELIGRVEAGPPYLNRDAEEGVRRVLDEARLVKCWLEGSSGCSTVAVDAPVAFAQEGIRRLTEKKCSASYNTPSRPDFEEQLKEQSDAYCRINNFWKCVGFAVYRYMAAKIDVRLAGAPLETLAALTCDQRSTTRRIRETFPSDVYKRANGHRDKDSVNGVLNLEARNVLKHLVAAEWQGTDSKGRSPAAQTLARLDTIRKFLGLDLELEDERRLCEMCKRSGKTGDLWDAFTCAFTACCEDHNGAEFHGLSDDRGERKRLCAEGAILTVKRNHA